MIRPPPLFPPNFSQLRGDAPLAVYVDLETYLERAFEGYWARQLDPGCLDEVATLAARCGLDDGALGAWAAGAGKEASDRIGAEFADAGVFQTPADLLGDEIFYGRQHLPMIRWLLEDRQGPAPI